ncbi:MAG: hypothetical protein KBT04_06255, partial [Bacteroidales bacterium]|nr:hypothetical protein [Candidatus Colimorpha onthohippi]
MKTPIKLVSLLYLAVICTSHISGQPSAHSVLSSGKWYKIGINTTGVYKLTVGDLNSLNGVAISKIAIYGLRGGILDEVNYSSTPDDMIQYPIWIQDNNRNGIFDGSDYLIFFAEGANVWQYDATNNRFSYLHNPYCNTNYCYLTTTETSPTRITSTAPCQPGLYPISRYTAVAVHDNDLTNAYGSGRIYVGEQFSAAVPNRAIALTIDPIPQGGTINCHFAFANMNAANSQVVLSLGSESYTTALPAEIGYNTNVHRFTSDGSTSLLFNIQYRPSEPQGDGYLDYIETNHLALLSYRSGQHIYHFSPEDSNKTYIISNCQSNTLLRDISSPYNVRQIPTTAGTTTFSFKGDSDHRLAAFTEHDCFKPSSISPIENQDLHSLPNVDYVIVTHPKYLPQSQQLANLHQTQSMLDVAVVTDQQVFDEFSSGRQDPIAIRQLMRVLYLRSQRNPSLKAPKYLLLFGKGTYDNRNIEGNNETTVVTYESVSSFSESSSFCSDDFFGYLDNGESGESAADKLDISIGRLPARNTE